MNFSQWLAILSAIIIIAGASSYIRDTLRGETEPNRVSWFIWALAPLIATGAAISAGADLWATSRVFLAGFIPLFVFFASFLSPGGFWKLGKFDLTCGAFSILALLVWLFVDLPRLAILLLIFVDGLASLPTYRKIWLAPETESGFMYVASLFSNLLIIPSIPVWNIENAAFQVFLIVNSSLFILMIYRDRLFHSRR